MFNDSYDQVILPYKTREATHKLHDKFSKWFYDGDIHVYNPFLDEGIIYQYLHSDKYWSKKIQWEHMGDGHYLLTCAVSGENNEPLQLVLYQEGFPLKELDTLTCSYWTMEYDMNTRVISNYEMTLSYDEKKVPKRLYEQSDIHKNAIQELILNNDFDKSCVDIFTFVLWCALQIPEKFEHDPDKDTRRSKRQIKDTKNHHGRVDRAIPLIRKSYNVCCTLSDVKRIRRAEPDHKVHVRGHWRRYKNGSVIWIEPFTKYNDKPDIHINKYNV